MREIKFRAWDSAPSKGNMIHEPNTVRDNELINDVFKDDSVVWMQYTGLKDKNGVEIYEGDIVTVFTNHLSDLAPSHPKKLTTVEVKFERAMFYFGDMTMTYMPLREAEFEVIGNIHENPELLEAKS